MAGIFDVNAKLDSIAKSVAAFAAQSTRTMKKKRKKRRKTIEELLGPEYFERHERTQRLLKSRIEYHERKLAEERSTRQSG